MSPETINVLRNGGTDRLFQLLWMLAGQWLERGGSDLHFRSAVSASQIAGSESAKAAFLAAGCDLYDLLAQVPQAREALLCLSTERISSRSKREGGVDA
ncbi:hypothetical protein ACOTF1_24650 [Achromobacter ruhlandii]|uniref:hypothetical protein n=1 Tax=Achromobacter ruhlandii TaxID=72557 RepID=UPI003B9CE5F4